MSLLTPMLRSSPLTDWFSDAQRVQGTTAFICIDEPIKPINIQPW